MDITEPIRLSTGSHVRGSGMGCAMNVVSWELGETRISDVPKGVHPKLATMVHMINDTVISLAGHSLRHFCAGAGPECARIDGACNGLAQIQHLGTFQFRFTLLDGAIGLELIKLAHLTIGTKAAPIPTPYGGAVDAKLSDVLAHIHSELSILSIAVKRLWTQKVTPDVIRQHLLAALESGQRRMDDAREIIGLPRTSGVAELSGVDQALRDMYVKAPEAAPSFLEQAGWAAGGVVTQPASTFTLVDCSAYLDQVAEPLISYTAVLDGLQSDAKLLAAMIAGKAEVPAD